MQLAKFLVPIDFNPHSAEAVRRAVDLAERYGAELVFTYVYEPADHRLPVSAVSYSSEQLARVTAEIQKRLDAVRREAEVFGARRTSTRLLQGAPAPSIVELAKAERFDMIVMGTHGRTGVDRWLMGSVAANVVRAAPCSVLTVKAPATA